MCPVVDVTTIIILLLHDLYQGELIARNHCAKIKELWQEDDISSSCKDD